MINCVYPSSDASERSAVFPQACLYEYLGKDGKADFLVVGHTIRIYENIKFLGSIIKRNLTLFPVFSVC